MVGLSRRSSPGGSSRDHGMGKGGGERESRAKTFRFSLDTPRQITLQCFRGSLSTPVASVVSRFLGFRSSVRSLALAANAPLLHPAPHPRPVPHLVGGCF